jgi:hemerythrin-like domain-containing protein
VRALLSSLAGKLGVHLAMEDKALYPRLAEDGAPPDAALAAAFMQEMGGLGAAFAAYNRNWPAPAIAADPAGFARETRAVFAALARRIERENRQLYPIADRVLARAPAGV